METKLCKKCGVDKNVSYYGVLNSNKDGYRDVCKSCKYKTDKMYRENNREKYLSTQKKYRDNNKYKISRVQKSYRDKNPSKVKIWQRKNYLNNQAVFSVNKCTVCEKSYETTRPIRSKYCSVECCKKRNSRYSIMKYHNRMNDTKSGFRQKVAMLHKEKRKNLVNSYVSTLLKRAGAENPELPVVNLKRKQLKLKRKINEIRKNVAY